MKEFDYSWDDQDPEQISDLVEGEYDGSLDTIENHGLDETQNEDDSGLCSCGDGGRQSECEDCNHALDCTESYCDNDEHQRVVNFGYPTSCTCSESKNNETCSGCGHSNTCDSEQQELCFTEPHSGLLVFLHYRQDCDCQGSQTAQQCPTCDHKSDCSDAIGLCRQVGYHRREGEEKWSQFLIHKIGSHMEEDVRRIPVQEVGRISGLPAEFWNRWIRQIITYDPDCAFESSLIGDLAASKPNPWHPLAHLDFYDFSARTRDTVIQLSGPGMDILRYKLTNPLAEKIREREHRSHSVHLLCNGDTSGVTNYLKEAKFVFNTTDQEWVLDISEFARGKTIDDLLEILQTSQRAWVKAVLSSTSPQLSINYMGSLHEVLPRKGSQ